MTVHRIDLKTPAKGYGKTLMSYRGASDSPIYAVARWLLANGIAAPGDTVATYRGETICMSGKAGELAKWTVHENDHGNSSLQLIKYRPPAHLRHAAQGQIPASRPSPVSTLPEPELADSGP